MTCDKRKASLYLPDDILHELQDEAQRLDRSMSWLIRRAWITVPRPDRAHPVDIPPDARMTWLRAWWLPVVVIGAAVAGGVWYVNHLRNQGNEAAQDRDRLALELAGANAVHEVTARDLRREVTRLTDTNAGLQAEIDKVRGAMPGAGVVGTASGSTGGITVGPAAGQPVVGCPPASAAGTSSPVLSQPCALYVGDKIEMRLSAVALQGDSGAIGIAATGQVYRVGSPPVLLGESPLKLDVKMRDPGEPPGWGVGAALIGFGGAAGGGWFGSVLVSPPPLRLFGAEGSLLVGGGVGPGGTWDAASGWPPSLVAPPRHDLCPGGVTIRVAYPPGSASRGGPASVPVPWRGGAGLRWRGPVVTRRGERRDPFVPTALQASVLVGFGAPRRVRRGLRCFAAHRAATLRGGLMPRAVPARTDPPGPALRCLRRGGRVRHGGREHFDGKLRGARLQEPRPLGTDAPRLRVVPPPFDQQPTGGAQQFQFAGVVHRSSSFGAAGAHDGQATTALP